MSWEFIFNAAAVSGAILAALYVFRSAGLRAGRAALVVSLLLGLGLTFVLARIQDRRVVELPVPENRPLEVLKGDFVGSQACRSCHPEEHASWAHSYHSKMTRLASPESVLGDFDNETVVADGREFKLERVGDEYFVELDADLLESGEGSPTPRIRRKVLMTTGSHHIQFCWLESGHSRGMEQLPLAWLIHEDRWVARNATFLFPPDEPEEKNIGRWNEICLRCHTTDGRPELVGASEMYTEASEFGISCEACHGPGREHVAYYHSPGNRYATALGGEGEDTMKDPVKLMHPMDSHVCGQCHAMSMEKTPELKAHWRKSGFTYRPGDDLTESRFVGNVKDAAKLKIMKEIDPYVDQGHFWPDGMIRVAGREFNGLMESPCFKRGEEDRRMSCFSCHLLHRPDDDTRPVDEWANDMLKPGMTGNDACLQCHEDIGKNLSAHTHHPTGTSGSVCYNCHMPHTTYALMGAIRSHQLDSPNVLVTQQTGRPNACNQCHLDKTLAWTAENLYEWFAQPVPPMNEEQKEVAASVLWLLRGDAGQRALTAWTYGWDAAREVSGTEWMPPYLGQLLLDPYDTVRFISHKALRKVPGFEDFEWDYEAPREDRSAAFRKRYEEWAGSPASRLKENRELLVGEDGRVDETKFNYYLRRRDDRAMFLME